MGWEPVKVRFKPISMSDEIQRINLLMSLANGNMISPQHILRELGIYDMDKELEDIQKYMEKMVEIRAEVDKKQKEIQAEEAQQLVPAGFDPSVPAKIVAAMLLDQGPEAMNKYFEKIMQIAPEFGDLVAQEINNLQQNLSPSDKDALKEQQEVQPELEENFGPGEKPEEEKIKARA